MNQKLFLYIILIYVGCSSYAQQSITYDLEDSCIKSVTYYLAPDSLYSISIKLNSDCAIKFNNFTGKNIGKSLKILKNGHLMVEAVIKGEIGSGLISIHNLQNTKEVLKYIKILIE